ncbi:MAG: glycosyltransferase, partial [Myxococcales bacterium]|nr:glycosyltransferase [Myxococcales bacterium]
PTSPRGFTGAPVVGQAAVTNRARARALHSVAALAAGGRTPSISALILNRDGAEHLEKLFASVAAHEAGTDLELVVVDHGSTDESRAVLRRWAERLDVQAILLDENDTFSASTNRAARAARGERLLLLNNDIIFTRPVLQALSSWLDDPRIGVVAPTLRFPRWHDRHPDGLQHGGIKFYPDARGPFLRPYNLSSQQGLHSAGEGAEEMPAVTAACAMMRRADFEALGGLHEGFVYGYEDVDLCLRASQQLGLASVIVHDLEAVHDESATQNKDPGPELKARRKANRELITARQGWALRRSKAQDALQVGRFLEDGPLVVGLAVTEAGPDATAGDYFTALELAEALESELGWRAVLLPATGDWYDLSGIDVLISLLDRYDLRRTRNARPSLLAVAWVRNWFDRWPGRPWFELYDLVLSSSDAGAAYLLEHADRRAEVLRIATAPERFRAGRRDEALAADVAFTGSRWNVPRAIESNLAPADVPGTVAVWGRGWSESPALAPVARGFLSYARMPDVYASSKIVVDDCIEQARPWGSVNSRVFDALGAGVLVVTNGELGARETFGELLPTYHDRASLSAVLTELLADDAAREARAAALQARVEEAHTYRVRARELKVILQSFRQDRLRIAIKVPATNHEVKEAWGDYHFALALRRSFWRLGHAVRIDILCEWDTPQGMDDDVVLVLRGLSRYQPNPSQVNLMWNISHPDKVTDEEYEAYDHVFVASVPHARTLGARLEVPVSALLQCTDPKLFYPDPSPDVPKAQVLFLGNSRKQLRPVVKDALEAGLPLTIMGGEWAGLVDPKYVAAAHVPNAEVRKHYSNASVLLNDHWPAMRDIGFLSNRLFDAAACGANIVSDPALGIEEVFGDAIQTYDTVEALRSIVQVVLREPEAARARGAALAEEVRTKHTFDNRAQRILEVAMARVRARSGERVAPRLVPSQEAAG